jgi:hypothetical protein
MYLELLVLVIVFITLVIWYRHTNPANPPTPPVVNVKNISLIDLTNAPNLVSGYNIKYALSQSYPGLYMDPNETGKCLAIYTDSSYYYGYVSSLDENGSCTTYGINSPGNGLVCFNPVSGSALPADSLSLLGIYSALQPGTNVPITSGIASYFQGSSSTTIGPSTLEAVDLNGNVAVVW